MHKRTAVSAAVATLLWAAVAAHAQETQRIEITGSSIKRIDAEGALPVQVLRREDIERTGATSAADLLQKLPAAQNSFSQAASVGGETLGFVGISLRGLGEQRTLVLLNGKRITQFGGQQISGSGAAVDLNAIPLAAIERVEVLTDGASALYGSDAIAGVVNFITRKNLTEGDASFGVSYPKGGARETRISATKGFGDLETNGFNVLISAGADKRTKLASAERDYTSSALVKFRHDGKQYQINSGSPSPIPANIVIPAVTDAAGNTIRPSEIVSPYFVQNGVCPPKSFKFGDRACYYDYLQDLEIYPEQERKNLLLQGQMKLGSSATLSAEFLYANSKQTARIAPVPGSIPVNASQLPVPIFASDGAPVTGPLSARYRVFDLGQRTSINESDLYHTSLAVDGTFSGWDYNLSYVHSVSKAKVSNKGYPEQTEFFNVLGSGLIDPFVGPGQQSQAGLDALRATLRNGYYNGGEASIDWIGLRGSRELTSLPGGPLSLGTGVSFQIERSKNKPSDLAQGISGTRFGDEAAVVPYDLTRKSAGAFLELVAPIAKTVEVSGALRYDKYQGVGDTTNFKVAARWTPATNLLFRASAGTGFHAPTLAQSRAPEQSFGVTSDQYDCTPALAAVASQLGGICRPDGDQYDVFAGGTPGLKPEKSKQFSMGFRFEPSRALSFGADYWFVAIRDAFGQISEAEYFSNPDTYRDLFRIKPAATGERYLAIFQGNQNLGKSYTSGIDFDVTGRTDTPVGRLTMQANMTYLLRNDYQLLRDGPYYSSLGRYGEDTQVGFRWQGRVTASLATSDAWAHTLAMNFKSGYADAVEEAEEIDANGNVIGAADIKRHVRSQVTFDWQTNWRITKAFSAQFGILNIFDRNPPFSITTGGLNKGQMRGYDDRYYDPRGRTFYVNASYKF